MSLLRVHHKRTTSIPRAYHEHTTSIPRAYHEHTTSIPRAYHERTTSVPRAYHEHTTSIPRTCHEHVTSTPRACLQLEWNTWFPVTIPYIMENFNERKTNNNYHRSAATCYVIPNFAMTLVQLCTTTSQQTGTQIHLQTWT